MADGLQLFQKGSIMTYKIPVGGFKSEDELVRFIIENDIVVHVRTKEELDCYVGLINRNRCHYTNISKFEHFTEFYYQSEVGWYIGFCGFRTYLFVRNASNPMEFEDLYKELV